MRQYYAHSKENVGEEDWQTLKDHLLNTGDLAFRLGKDARIAELARTAGYLHDLGKYSDAFQDRLRGSRHRVDHATAGAREVLKLFPEQPQRMLAEVLSYCIVGHHSGLPDHGSMADTSGDGTLIARREKKELEDYSVYQGELDRDLFCLEPPRIRVNREHPGFSLSFLIRMLYSTLVDADWLETEQYMQEGRAVRGGYASVEELTRQFNEFLQQYSVPEREIDRRRTETLQQCMEMAEQDPGFFTLTVPTGGGKTYSSMAFALNHARRHGLQRVIYVIPFTSIIEQNTDRFRNALGPLGEANILEHHSNYDWEGMRAGGDDETNRVVEKLKLASENWDIPIVVTTNVQFFESLFSNKKTGARKLHNLAKSVIIFDEVQMLPLQYLKPSMLAVQELVRNYDASTVFCSATQPALDRFFPEDVAFQEMVQNPEDLYAYYRRVSILDLGEQTDEQLLDRLHAHEQVLCIVNTRRHARGLFDGLEEDGRFHLSTLMCPMHRRQILEEIHEYLQARETCRVISTQVMEAGIDIDFPVGYRALAGLDSIIQAAGRVNREGTRTEGAMYVFRPNTEWIKRTPTFIEQTAAVAGNILREHEKDPAALDAIAAYYHLLYSLHDDQTFDVKGILGYLDRGSNRLDFDFATAAEHFKLIENNSVSVLIPFDKEAQRLIASLPFITHPASLLRKLQPYVVNIYEHEFQALYSQGVIRVLQDRYPVLDESWMGENGWYHPQSGLKLVDREGGEALFFE